MIRPQILLSIGLLGSITFFAMFWGETEIATGGITLIGALSMKILEKEQEDVMVIQLWPKDPDCTCAECTCDRADFGEKKECECMECNCEKCHEEEEEN